jgi:rare lipoprotein A
LPFGTRLRVTRTDTNQAPVCVTVNDRGPFAGRRRIVDLSRRAAEALEMIGEGVVPVRVDVL